jgi:hypothetical protein
MTSLNPFSDHLEFSIFPLKYEIYHYCKQKAVTNDSIWCCNHLRLCVTTVTQLTETSEYCINVHSAIKFSSIYQVGRKIKQWVYSKNTTEAGKILDWKYAYSNAGRVICGI